MNIIVRLYWQHDLDLVSLNMRPDFPMGFWMKNAVTAFALKNGTFKIPLPKNPMPYCVKLDNCCTHFVLIPGQDDAVIRCLQKVRYGYRNCMIKLIFRRYLESPALDPFYDEQIFQVKSRGKRRKALPPSFSPPASSKRTSPAASRKSSILTCNEQLTDINERPMEENEESCLDIDDAFDLFGAVSDMIK